jgi:2-polyprenyl-3-methyl-5-hydroxy-6-metoxy-1,4-benzoquinol methylase
MKNGNSTIEFQQSTDCMEAKNLLKIIRMDLYEISNMEILEVGCGCGNFSYQVAKTFNLHHVTLSDMENYVDKNHFDKNGIKTSFIEMNLESDLNISKQFDLVFNTDVIEHLEKDKKALENMFSLVKVGGLLIVGTPNLYRIGNLMLKLLGKLHFPRKLGEDVYGDCIHIREYSPSMLINLAKCCKFKEMKIYKVGFMLPYINLCISSFIPFMNQYNFLVLKK